MRGASDGGTTDMSCDINWPPDSRWRYAKKVMSKLLMNILIEAISVGTQR